MTSKNDELILSRMWAEKAQAIEAYGGPVTAQVYAAISSRVHWCKLFKNHAPAVHTCYCGEPHE